MQVTVHGESRYIPVSTVTLSKAGDGVTFPFHCTSCGNTLAVIGGNVTKIYPILEPSDQITVVQTCKSCKAKYVFHDGGEPIMEAVMVLLNSKEYIQPFYCYLGGGGDKSLNHVIDYDIKQIYSFGESRYMHTPFTVKCPNPGCSISYHFNKLS